MNDATGHSERRDFARIVLGGDVMIGRGIDQVLPYPCPPRLYEGYVKSAMDYVHLAETVDGTIPKPVAPSYVWGEALCALDHLQPDVRIVNLETAVTRSEDAEPKGINYRVSPENAECLAAARIDCCVLANNHVLDWGRAGLSESLETLHRMKIRTAGAGEDLARARAPAVLDLGGGARLLVFAFACPDSGVPRHWAATDGRAGVNLLPDLSQDALIEAASDIRRAAKPGDIVIISMHWGPNWGYDVPANEQRFARELVDEAGATIVYGHSSHHPKPIEVHGGRLILYGCGDLLNDYEGIAGYEEFRSDLALLYVVDVTRATGRLAALHMIPLRIHRFQLRSASGGDTDWLASRLNLETHAFGTIVSLNGDGSLRLSWRDSSPPDPSD